MMEKESKKIDTILKTIIPADKEDKVFGIVKMIPTMANASNKQIIEYLEAEQGRLIKGYLCELFHKYMKKAIVNTRPGNIF